MKKILTGIILAATFLAGVSCSEIRPSSAETAGEGTTQLTVFTEDAATRTTLSANEGKFEVFWSSGDAIEVVGKGTDGISKDAKFAIKSGSGTSVGTFSGELPETTGPCYALFPYRGDATVSDGALHFKISKNKGAQLNNIAAKTVPAFAEVQPNGDGTANVNLKNAGGLLALAVTSSPNVSIKKITIHDLGGNMLWGDCTVPIRPDGSLDYDNATLENGDNTISMRWNTSVTFNSTVKTYYFPVPAGAFDRGFSVVFYQLDLTQPDSLGRAYSFTQKVTSPVTMGRSEVIQMEPLALVNKAEPLDVKARGYYKSLFVDGGMYLTTNVKASQLPAISYLGLDSDFEYFGSGNGVENKPYQNGVMVSSPTTGTEWNDANGVLLYPDGEPRFRVFYSNGGTSYNHGPSLGDDGRKRVHDFYMNGGSYTGSCAGSFLGSTYVDNRNRYDSGDGKDFTYGIWPGNLNHTHLPINLDYPSIYTGMKVLPALAELGYYPSSFIANDTIEDTRHHGGSYLPHDKYNKGLERVELMTFQYSDKSIARDTCQYRPENLHRPMYIYKNKPVDIVDSVSTWSYKTSDETGRLVVTGSHPEAQKRGRQRDFTAMMWRYAMDGNGDVYVKGNLELGYKRVMDKTTADNDPLFTRIGDKQYHHFRFVTDEDIEEFAVILDSDYDAESGINLCLSLRRDDFAWLTDADYALCQKGGKKELKIKKLPAGTWYIGVYCATTVDATATSELPYYFIYSGKTEVLDGIPYSIKATRYKTFTAVTSQTRSEEGNKDVSFTFDD